MVATRTFDIQDQIIDHMFHLDPRDGLDGLGPSERVGKQFVNGKLKRWRQRNAHG